MGGLGGSDQVSDTSLTLRVRMNWASGARNSQMGLVPEGLKLSSTLSLVNPLEGVAGVFRLICFFSSSEFNGFMKDIAETGSSSGFSISA